MTVELTLPTRQESTGTVPWVIVDHHDNMITCGPGILFVYPPDVGAAYNQFIADCGGYIDKDNLDALEKLHEAVQTYVDDWERKVTAKE